LEPDESLESLDPPEPLDPLEPPGCDEDDPLEPNFDELEELLEPGFDEVPPKELELPDEPLPVRPLDCVSSRSGSVMSPSDCRGRDAELPPMPGSF
jgi:hypothetical protein